MLHVTAFSEVENDAIIVKYSMCFSSLYILGCDSLTLESHLLLQLSPLTSMILTFLTLHIPWLCLCFFLKGNFFELFLKNLYNPWYCLQPRVPNFHAFLSWSHSTRVVYCSSSGQFFQYLNFPAASCLVFQYSALPHQGFLLHRCQNVSCGFKILLFIRLIWRAF